MSADYARTLARRIAEYQQWQLADAVRSGDQTPRDPDVEDLVEMGEDFRLYARRAGQRMRKRLVDGRWETEIVH